MRTNTSPVLPPARTHQLVIEELPDEVLVYDLDRHKAHCLNKTSSLIWKHCDGETTIEEMTRLLAQETGALVEDDFVWLALSQLRRFHLLDEGSTKVGRMKVSRRDLVSKYLPAALALPLILSVPAPTKAQAASATCAMLGESCEVLPCCQGLTCDGTCFPDSPP